MISADRLAVMEQQGVIGDIGGQFITQAGELHPCDYNQRMIGLTLDEMKHIPNVMAVALGLNKISAILGGLRTGAVDVLCADLPTARAVLGLETADL